MRQDRGAMVMPCRLFRTDLPHVSKGYFKMFQDSIRMGTLVPGGPKTADYIRQILPHGFASFSITWWQKIGDGVDLKRMAREVKAVLADSDAVINSVSCFGNRLMNRPI